MDIGFTGTREGMTQKQYSKVAEILDKLDSKRAHHGDCIGADAQFHQICRGLGFYIVGHPGMDSAGNSPKRAYCDVDEVEPTVPYFVRNSDIVNKSMLLIATPKGFVEENHSGTWATIRKARRKRRTIFIVFPNGTSSSDIYG